MQDNNEINIKRRRRNGHSCVFHHGQRRYPAPSIVITHSFDSSNSAHNVDNLPGLIAPDIQVSGEVANLDGSVTFFNESGSIVSSGNIHADTLNITAGRDFVQKLCRRSFQSRGHSFFSFFLKYEFLPKYGFAQLGNL